MARKASKPNRVFVSHSHDDREFVEREIVALLRDHGVKVWYATEDIKTASQWEQSIRQGLQQSDWFLVVLSPRSVNSEWVGAEVHWAMDERRRQFVPVLAEDCEWQDLHLMMRRIQYVDFRRDLDDARRRLLDTWGIVLEPAKSDDSRAPHNVTPKQTDEPPPPVTGDITRHLEIITNSIGMELVLIPPGDFLMGSPEEEKDRRDDETLHRVRITEPFHLSVYKVTQSEYERVMGENPSHFSSGGGGNVQVSNLETSRFPVEQVTWEDAIDFCRKLSLLPEEKAAGRIYRLPTEAEWEYACRASTATPFHFGSQLNGREANCDGTPYGTDTEGPYLGRTTSVGSYQPNAFGLYDMHGNVSFTN